LTGFSEDDKSADPIIWANRGMHSNTPVSLLKYDLRRYVMFEGGADAPRIPGEKRRTKYIAQDEKVSPVFFDKEFVMIVSTVFLKTIKDLNGQGIFGLFCLCPSKMPIS
jgi:hypothetical protein